MVSLKRILFTLIFLFASCSYGKSFDERINQILIDHYNKYKNLEYFSGASLSIGLPNEPIKNYYIGYVSHDPHSAKISADTLFQIGSITKSFTAAVVLQLENEKKLSLEDTIKKWLPQYHHWSNINIKSLLNMTSGLPNYTDAPLMNAAVSYHLTQAWNDDDLIKFVYPQDQLSPPLKKGFFYTNTGYILAALIIKNATLHSFNDELMTRTIKLANLKNTFYLDERAHSRLAHGYNFNQYDNPALVGKDVTDNNMTWAGAAGAIVSNSEDVIKWVRALFIENTILNTAQRNKLTQLVSQNTGNAIKETTNKDNHGFGLGVAQKLDPNMGRFWFYEGETLGFRALYLYQPCNGIIIATIFNSATYSENDHTGLLMEKIYQTLLNQYPQFHCKTRK